MKVPFDEFLNLEVAEHARLLKDYYPEGEMPALPSDALSLKTARAVGDTHPIHQAVWGAPPIFEDCKAMGDPKGDGKGERREEPTWCIVRTAVSNIPPLCPKAMIGEGMSAGSAHA